MQARIKATGEIYTVIRFENVGTPNEVVILDINGVETAYSTRDVEII